MGHESIAATLDDYDLLPDANRSVLYAFDGLTPPKGPAIAPDPRPASDRQQKKPF